MPLILGLPDMISPSYFPAIAAADLGMFADEGLDVEIRLVPPVTRTLEELRDDEVQLVAGSAHSVPAVFPDWEGAHLLCALSRHTYWFLVVRGEFAEARHDLRRLSGTRIAAAPMVELALRRVLTLADVADVEIVPLPASEGDDPLNFGLTAARALENGLIDGFWANGMGAAVAAERSGATVALDARREEARGAQRFTFAAMLARDDLETRFPGASAATVRAIAAAHAALREDPSRATGIAERRFPPLEASLIANLIARDAPYFDAALPNAVLGDLMEFEMHMGLLAAPVPVDRLRQP